MKTDSNRLLYAAASSALLLLSAATAHAQEVPETYRSNVQLLVPLTSEYTYTALGSYSSTSGTPAAPGRTTLIAIPAGLDFRLDRNWSLQTYVQFNRDSFHAGVGRLEIRPVGGVTYRTRLSDVVEAGAWLRYEARFLDVTGNESFQNRLRLRPYVDYKFGRSPGAAGSWHLRGEYEPRYVFGGGSSFINGQQFRLTAGYKVADNLMADLRFAHDLSRPSRSSSFSATNNSVTLQFNYTLGAPSARKQDPLE